MARINRIGEIHLTNEGYKLKIVEYINNLNIVGEFDNGLRISNLKYVNIVSGQVSNPYHPSVCGIGYEGIGKYSYKSHPIIRKKWNSMLQRCYSEKSLLKHPTYKDCIVAESWHNFQNFAQWFEENYVEGFELDKDILLKGNKVYCSNLCCFVPQEINKLLNKSSKTRGKYPVGVRKKEFGFESRVNINNESVYLGLFKTPEKAFIAYKKAKEKEIRATADFCKDLIPQQVYEALYNYKVEIND